MAGDELKAQQKLQWLGLSSAANSLSNVEGEVELLQQNLEDFETFLDHLQNGYDLDGDGDKEPLDSYSVFNDYLVDIGFSQSEADSFIEKIKQNFSDEDGDGTSFDEFKNFVINEVVSFESLKTGFGTSNSITGDTTTSSGQAAAGVKFHETSGVTRNGISVPSGTTEVYGKQIHFSQTGEPTEPEETGTITFKNISSDPLSPDVGQTVTVSADIENTQNEDTSVVATFIEDGTRIDTKTVRVGSGSTESVSFDVFKNSMESHEYKIKTTNGITVAWVPSELIRL